VNAMQIKDTIRINWCKCKS